MREGEVYTLKCRLDEIRLPSFVFLCKSTIARSTSNIAKYRLHVPHPTFTCPSSPAHLDHHPTTPQPISKKERQSPDVRAYAINRILSFHRSLSLFFVLRLSFLKVSFFDLSFFNFSSHPPAPSTLFLSPRSWKKRRLNAGHLSCGRRPRRRSNNG